MKINITYCSTKHYNKSNITQWIWMFKKYKNVKGFIFRIFGIYFNVRESNATEKLIKISQSKTEELTNVNTIFKEIVDAYNNG